MLYQVKLNIFVQRRYDTNYALIFIALTVQFPSIKCDANRKRLVSSVDKVLLLNWLISKSANDPNKKLLNPV